MSLLKTALNRLTKEILKRPGHFNTEELVAAGALRSKDRFRDAIHTSNNRYLDKIQSKHPEIPIEVSSPIDQQKRLEMSRMGGYSTHSGGSYGIWVQSAAPKKRLGSLLSPFHSVFDNKTTKSMKDGLAIRHELHEASDILHPTTQARLNRGGAYYSGSFVNSSGKSVGNHSSPAVLGKENNDLVTFYSKRALGSMPHGEAFKSEVGKSWNKAKGGVAGYRAKSEEAASMQRLTGKRFGVDRLSNQEIEKLHHAVPDTKVAVGNTYRLSHSPSAAATERINSKVTEKMLAANDLANPYHNTYNYE